MKRIRKSFRIFCLFLSMLMLLTACGTSNDPIGTTVRATQKGTSPQGTTAPQEDPTVPPLDGGDPNPPAQTPTDALSVPLLYFQIVRKVLAFPEITDAILSLNSVVHDKTGQSLRVKTDDTDTPASDYELLIGRVNRAEAQAAYANLKEGDYFIKTVVTDRGAKLMVGGYSDKDTLLAMKELEQMISTGVLMNQSGNVKLLDKKYNPYGHFPFTVELGEAIPVAQAPLGTQAWGPYQFPQLQPTKDGNIHLTWSLHNDSIEGFEGKSHDFAVSEDNGQTWRPATEEDVVAYPVMMENGKAFAGFVGQGAYAVDFITEDIPYIGGMGGTRVYRAEDLIKVGLDTSVKGLEYDPETGELTTFDVTLNWPNMPITVYYGNTVYPVCQMMAITSSDMGLIALDDGLYFCTYARTLGPAGNGIDYRGWYSVFVFRSTDNGRTWNMINEIAVDKATHSTSGSFEGLCEPKIEQMPDGSVVILMRTGSGQPSYMVRSIDNCKTWSTPTRFDRVGVLPQIMTLGCGVTIATYGRPGVFVRATGDPTGQVWLDPIEIKLNTPSTYSGQSCCYTRLIAIDDYTALMTYTDFNYPDENGVARKTVLVRTIKIIPTAA